MKPPEQTLRVQRFLNKLLPVGAERVRVDGDMLRIKLHGLIDDQEIGDLLATIEHRLESGHLVAVVIDMTQVASSS